MKHLKTPLNNIQRLVSFQAYYEAITGEVCDLTVSDALRIHLECMALILKAQKQD